MKVNLKFKAISILMAGLPENQKWVVYLMGMGKAMPTSVTKEDLISIITFLFKQLDWIDHQESSSQLKRIPTTVIDERKDDITSQNSDSHSVATSKSIQKYANRSSEENFVTINNKPVVFDCDIENNTSVNENVESMDLDEGLDESIYCLEADAPQSKINSLEEANKSMFGCALCDQTFSKERYLAAHMWMKHEREKPQENSPTEKHKRKCDEKFSCSQCDYKCSQKSYLKLHERIHNGDKPFSCSQCDYKCKRKANLNSHERIHTGDKPFSCSQCDYKCTQAGTLKIHVRTHTGDKPFSCSQCDYKCTMSGTLKTHERIHTGDKPFSCSQCDYKCSRKSYLRIHERIHNGDKPFSCSQCDYKCTQAGSLKIHERTHTSDKPFSCSKCDKTFAYSSTLKSHERLHTDEKPSATAQSVAKNVHHQSSFLQEIKTEPHQKGSISRHLRSHERTHTDEKSSTAQGVTQEIWLV